MFRAAYRCVLSLVLVICASQAAMAACPCSIWSPTSAPGIADSGDPNGVELGTKFRADQNGYVTGIRFYKSANNTGSHVGNLWNTSGTLLATATFANESSSGWQQVNFSAPVAIVAGTTYIVSYYAPNGHYAFDSGFFANAGVDNAPLHALQNGVDGSNGVYTYNTTTIFPASSYNSTNYWVDVVYLPTSAIAPPTVSSTVPAANSAGAGLNGPITATFNQPMNPATMTSTNFVVTDSSNNVVPGVVSFDAPSSTLSFTPNSTLNGLSVYKATVKAAVSSYFGQAMGADYAWTFTTASLPATGNCPCTLWPATTTPSVVDSGDGSGIELGVKFKTDYNGLITGVRFYKSTANVGAHIGSLWNSSGTRLATVTFTNESSSGWQQANFSTPVSVTAGTTYVVSYYAPNGHYAYTSNFFASSGADNAPLHALQNGVNGGNGVYNYGSSSIFPTSSFGAANYWVDVVYFQSNSTTPPLVSSATPAAGASQVSLSTAVSVKFNQPMNSSSMTVSNFVLRDASNNLVSGTVNYDSVSSTFTFQPASTLNALSVYTATVKGSVLNFLGTAMGVDYSWSFTTSHGCPCTIWPPTTTPAVVDSGDNGGVELGVKFTADFNGAIVGVRFYKSAANVGTHVGNLWTAAGSLLATATFTSESASGWQQVVFSSPVTVTAGTAYVASYYAPNGHYSWDQGAFNFAGFDNAPLHALSTGAASGNGVYSYGTKSAFPTSSYDGTNYWVDVVYDQGSGNAPPTVTSVNPGPGASGVGLGSMVSVSFSQPMDPTSIASSTFTVFDPSNSPIPGTLTYDPGSFSILFQPNPEFAALSTYTVVVSSAVRNVNSQQLGSNYSWNFSTTNPPPSSGPGGPVLLITSETNPYTQYLSEILLAEGLNAFTSQDISAITPAVLSNYDVVILGDMKLTPTQVNMISSWVTTGGNLIAMHPDKQLAALLGLSSTSSTLSNSYLGVVTTAAPGQGIVSSTMQFHGPADLYNSTGAVVVAKLYSNATTATNSPAVTWINAGVGHAAAFTYDLARSIVYMRQGNPAWSGVQRIPYNDATCPNCDTTIIRAEDMFFGNASFDPEPDWINLSKVAVPQGDEQQRLLINMVEFLNANHKPLPRFWYLPSGFKAAVIMTGDDHDNGGTSGRFDQYISDSTPGCSVPDWTCIRSTSYVFPFTPIPNYSSYVSQGFEIANHGDNVLTCTNFTADSLNSAITTQLSEMSQNYPGLPASKTNRTHCVVWSDYDSEPKVLLSHGIRLDTSYYYWPPEWALNQPGMFTGSGFPMRYADHTGVPIDVYQATTQMPDESNFTYPSFIDTLLSNATGANGYYGVFTANMHTDLVESPGSDSIIAEAQKFGVPVISSLQMLTWLDGRNNSTFGSLSWSSNTLSFTITAATGSRNIQAMVPMKAGTTTLRSIKKSGVTVSFTTQTIKGLQYAFFAASTGSYTATYQ